MYEMAYNRYVESSKKHGMEPTIDFFDFLNRITKEQIELLLNEVNQ